MLVLAHVFTKHEAFQLQRCLSAGQPGLPSFRQRLYMRCSHTQPQVLLGLVFGSSILGLLSRFPTNLLGAMLLMSGLELAGTIRQASGGALHCCALRMCWASGAFS